MIAWFAVGALALGSFLFAAFLLRMPREGWTLFAAALVFGLAGYAWQGSPEQPSSPKPMRQLVPQSGEQMVAARLSLFEETSPKPAFLITSDGFARRGQFGNAAGLLRNGLNENPDFLEGWLALGMALVGHADGNVTPAARVAYDRASAFEPENPSPQFLLGIAYLQGGDVREARAVWGELLLNSPDDAPWRADLEQRIEGLDRMIANAPMLQGQ